MVIKEGTELNKPRTIAVPDALWAQVTAAAKRDGVPVSEYVRRLLVAATVPREVAILRDVPPTVRLPGVVLKAPITAPTAHPTPPPWSAPRGLSKAEQVAHSPKGMRASPAIPALPHEE